MPISDIVLKLLAKPPEERHHDVVVRVIRLQRQVDDLERAANLVG